MSKVSASLPNLSKLVEKIKGAEGKLQAGWFPGANYDDGTPVAGIAAIQEFGSAKRSIPPRPFFRPAITENKKAWAELVKDGARAYLNGDIPFEYVLEGLGLQVVGDIKNKIVTGNHLELSPITIALRKLRNDGYEIGGSMVGAVASAIAEGRTGSGELGDQSFGNKTPLQETGFMLASLTHEVSK